MSEITSPRERRVQGTSVLPSRCLAEPQIPQLQTLHPIVASGHTFGGGRDAMLEQLKASLVRIAGR